MNPAELLPQVYDELRKLAASKMLAENPGHTLDATALVHEVFLKLGADQSFESTSAFMMAAAQAMRRILVDHARTSKAQKRGAGQRFELQESLALAEVPDEELVALDDALLRLAEQQPRVAELVQLRFFTGLTIPQAAQILNISPRTADAWWAYARGWLATELKKED